MSRLTLRLPASLRESIERREGAGRADRDARLDENLGVRGAAELQAAGHDVATVLEQGLTSATDRTLNGVCGADGRCLVTPPQR